MQSFTAARDGFIGVSVQWCAALLVLMLFHHLSRLGTQRRVMATWRGAWLALLLGLSGYLVGPLLEQVAHQSPGIAGFAGGLLFAAGKLAFLALVFLGAMQSANHHVRPHIEYGIVFAASALGALIAVQFGDAGSAMALVFVTPIVMFGAAFVVVRIAAGARGVALRRMTMALGMYGALWLYYLATFVRRAWLGGAGELFKGVDGSAWYAEAFVASALGAGIVFLMVQDSFIEVASARSGPIRDVLASEPGVIMEPLADASITRGAEFSSPSVAGPDHGEQLLEASEAHPLGTSQRTTVPITRHAAVLPRPIRLDGGGHAEVMIIDDESAVRATLARIFHRGGWPVRQAASAEEGLAWLLTAADAELPPLIICALKMPGMDGIALHNLLRARRPIVLSRLMFVTGDILEPATAEFLATAGRPVVEKPFTVAEIARGAEDVLGQRIINDG